MATLRGIFLAPTCREHGYMAKMILRNTLRNPEDPLKREKQHGIRFSAFALDQFGEVILHTEVSGEIPIDSYFEFESQKPNTEMLVGITEIKTEKDAWFEQEHEISYKHALSKARPAVIYDQLPFRLIENYSPIILLNHKCYVSKKIQAVIMLSNYRGPINKALPKQSLELSFFDCNGNLLKRNLYNIPYNSVSYFNVRDELKDILNLSESLQLITVTAKGGNSIFAIQTGIINDNSHNMAIEHSLAPPYFVSQNMGEVRINALKF